MASRPFLKFILPLCLLHMVLTYLFSWVFWAMHHDNSHISLFVLWKGWDAAHYLNIVREGYSNDLLAGARIAFFPLYPFVVWLLDKCVHHAELSGLIVSNICFIVSAHCLYQLVALDYGARRARDTVVLLCIFPTAYFFHAIYTESIFLMLALGAVLSYRTGRFFWCAVCCFFAPLARIHGLLLGVFLMGEYLLQPKGQKRRVPVFVCLLSVLAGFYGYLLVNYAVYGDHFEFLTQQQRGWGRGVALPIEGLKVALRKMQSDDLEKKLLIGLAEILACVAGLVATIFSFKKLRLSYSLFLLAGWCLVSFNSFWMSQPRHLLCLFPFFIVAAPLLRKRMALLFITLICIFAYAFLVTNFVNYHWAF